MSMPLSPSGSFARRRQSDGACRRPRSQPLSRRAAPRHFVARRRRRARSLATSRRFISTILRWPVPALSATARPGTTSCWRCGRDSIAPPTRSIDPGRHESSPTRCTPISTGSTSGEVRASRCCATFTAAAASPRGCVPCSHSAMSTACASTAAPSRCRKSWPAARRPQAADPDCLRLVDILRSALEIATARLEPRDRLRLRCYYAQQLTLAQTGTLLKEHEATTSRQLARTRKIIRDSVEQELRSRGLKDAEIARCFECATEDVGATNLDGMLDVRSG